jgi:signal transduction histidine kinase
MSAGLAHESRNALQRIQASAEMLELEVGGNREALKLVQNIYQAQSHMHQLLDEVRGYAGPITLDRSACRLADVWHEAWDLLGPQRQDRKAEFRACPECTEARLSIDRFRMTQVFRNLLENALTAGEGPVTIDVDCHREVGRSMDAERAKGSAERPGWRISVRDDGPGMTAEQRQRAFEPFFTTKPKGTGLGMSIAQRIVEAHGGQIEIAASDAAGTEIVIRLPCDQS